jgi:hypothetical protein
MCDGGGGHELVPPKGEKAKGVPEAGASEGIDPSLAILDSVT